MGNKKKNPQGGKQTSEPQAVPLAPMAPVEAAQQSTSSQQPGPTQAAPVGVMTQPGAPAPVAGQRRVWGQIAASQGIDLSSLAPVLPAVATNQTTPVVPGFPQLAAPARQTTPVPQLAAPARQTTPVPQLAARDHQTMPVTPGLPQLAAPAQQPVRGGRGGAQQKAGRMKGTTATVVSQPGTRSQVAKAAFKPPKRDDPKGGTLGRPIQLAANHFAVTIKPGAKIFHYDIAISPAKSKTMDRKVIEQFLRSRPDIVRCTPVFDGKKNVYTARRIEGLNSQITVEYQFQEQDRSERKDTNFSISLQPTGELEIDLAVLEAYCKAGSSTNVPLRPIQALDIALKSTASTSKIVIGSSLMSKDMGQPFDLGGGVEAWFGHFQSLRLGWKPFMIIDASQRAFVKGGAVHDMFAQECGFRSAQELRDWRLFNEVNFGKKIATLKVEYPRGGYMASVGCNGIKGAANKEVFECDGKKVTVQQYFEQKYGKKLKFPDLPCLWVGSREKKNLVPMEICTIREGQEYRRKLNDIQTSNMIKVAAKPADERREKIMKAVNSMNFAADPCARDYGISVDNKMVRVIGRVLPAPTLIYGEKENDRCSPRDGSWNMVNKRFVDAKCMMEWGVINITRDANDFQIEEFAKAIFKAGTGMGMAISKYKFIKHIDSRDLKREMEACKKEFPNLQILFVIINKKGDPTYEVVKSVGDLQLRLTTQCVQSRNVRGKNGPDMQTMSNICMKLNAKLGGVNNLIDRSVRPEILLKEQVIIMGADVTHPGADQQDSGKPSIAAVVGSVDPRAFRYCAEIRVQKSKQEYIEDMEDMVYQVLLKFNKIAGTTSTGKPQRIVFFRDGVSEGQFQKVMDWEISAIRKACMKLSAEYDPPITYLVVQKRHHTRLFAEDQRDKIGRGLNVPPGTVVDTLITHPVENDFFLVSHYGIQGTSRPTHYHLLWDDSNMSSNELQKLTYYLCYMFSRCTRSVSYPAPCYYAHLVAYRGRQYYDELTKMNSRVTNSELQRSVDGCRDLQFMFFV